MSQPTITSAFSAASPRRGCADLPPLPATVAAGVAAAGSAGGSGAEVLVRVAAAVDAAAQQEASRAAQHEPIPALEALRLAAPAVVVAPPAKEPVQTVVVRAAGGKGKDDFSIPSPELRAALVLWAQQRLDGGFRMDCPNLQAVLDDQILRGLTGARFEARLGPVAPPGVSATSQLHAQDAEMAFKVMMVRFVDDLKKTTQYFNTPEKIQEFLVNMPPLFVDARHEAVIDIFDQARQNRFKARRDAQTGLLATPTAAAGTTGGDMASQGPQDNGPPTWVPRHHPQRNNHNKRDRPTDLTQMVVAQHMMLQQVQQQLARQQYQQQLYQQQQRYGGRGGSGFQPQSFHQPHPNSSSPAYSPAPVPPQSNPWRGGFRQHSRGGRGSGPL